MQGDILPVLNPRIGEAGWELDMEWNDAPERPLKTPKEAGANNAVEVIASWSMVNAVGARVVRIVDRQPWGRCLTPA